jgi:hypothetical protein
MLSNPKEGEKQVALPAKERKGCAQTPQLEHGTL